MESNVEHYKTVNENSIIEIENLKRGFVQLENSLRDAKLTIKLLENEKAQLVIQMEILMMSNEVEAQTKNPYKLLDDKFTAERELTTTRMKYESALREIERVSAELESLRQNVLIHKKKYDEQFRILKSNLIKTENEFQYLDQLLNQTMHVLRNSKDVINTPELTGLLLMLEGEIVQELSSST